MSRRVGVVSRDEAVIVENEPGHNRPVLTPRASQTTARLEHHQAWHVAQAGHPHPNLTEWDDARPGRCRRPVDRLVAQQVGVRGVPQSPAPGLATAGIESVASRQACQATMALISPSVNITESV